MDGTCKFYDIPCYLDWFFNELLIVIQNLFNQLTGAVASLIEAIPAPDFLLGGNLYTVPSSVSYWLEILRFEYGLSIIAIAYTSRFIVRRIL